MRDFKKTFQATALAKATQYSLNSASLSIVEKSKKLLASKFDVV